MPLDGEMALAAALRHLDQLAGHGDPLVQPLGFPDREVPCEERRGERPVVLRLARELDRLARQLLAPLARDEVDREAEPRQKARPQGEVGLPDLLERLLEQLDLGLIDRPDLRALDDP